MTSGKIFRLKINETLTNDYYKDLLISWGLKTTFKENQAENKKYCINIIKTFLKQNNKGEFLKGFITVKNKQGILVPAGPFSSSVTGEPTGITSLRNCLKNKDELQSLINHPDFIPKVTQF